MEIAHSLVKKSTWRRWEGILALHLSKELLPIMVMALILH